MTFYHSKGVCVILCFLSFLQSLFYQYVTILFEKRFGLFVDSETKAHAVHKNPTPRVGGIGIFLAFSISIAYGVPEFLWLVYSSAIVFGFGLYEDWHGDTSKIYRLSAMGLATVVAIYFGGYVADNSEFFILPYAIAIVFTIFTVIGMSSAMNFIDGLNGLASGVSLVSLAAFGTLAYIYDDLMMVYVCLSLFGAVLGFYVWNFPYGKIFLGDGGAYFLGFILAMLSIILSGRHPEITLWYTLAALSYPVIETLVTIKRRINRKKKNGTPFFEAERVHLHTLKFKRQLRNNAKASWRLVTFHGVVNILALLIHHNIPALILLICLTFAIYMNKYTRILKFKN
ncbi:MAG: undecaprenyl/decaprenyl-phosphate alpha-N-acetylglucosaminyl 1-phosphate transferase [Erysipelotrichia bacterium]|nr:undecaprenyl/decaprenyl-phosphate alpha-N-acetylglucosaminyl 1-phosphate transferase [Erysipelotrichia bacterium]